MPKELTLTLPDSTYEYLHSRGVPDTALGDYILSRIEPPARRHLSSEELEEAYRIEAADEQREAEAREWCSHFSEDIDTEWDDE